MGMFDKIREETEKIKNYKKLKEEKMVGHNYFDFRKKEKFDTLVLKKNQIILTQLGNFLHSLRQMNNGLSFIYDDIMSLDAQICNCGYENIRCYKYDSFNNNEFIQHHFELKVGTKVVMLLDLLTKSDGQIFELKSMYYNNLSFLDFKNSKNKQISTIIIGVKCLGDDNIVVSEELYDADLLVDGRFISDEEKLKQEETLIMRHTNPFVNGLKLKGRER